MSDQPTPTIAGVPGAPDVAGPSNVPGSPDVPGAPEVAGAPGFVGSSDDATPRSPRSSRDLFQILSLYDPRTGLDALLAQIDLSGLTPSVVYDVVHRRPPDAGTMLQDSIRKPVDVLRSALLREEFQDRIISHVLAAYPELRRRVFFQVPRCPGTDLITALAKGRLTVSKMLEHESLSPRDAFFSSVGKIARAAQYVDAIFVHGRMLMADYIEQNAIRPQDELFTIIHDPIDLMVKQANDAIDCLVQDPTGALPDAAYTLACLAMESLPREASPAFLQELALRVLQDSRLCQPNTICRYLSATHDATYKAALAATLYCNLEIVTSVTYLEWLQTRWGLQGSMAYTRPNQHIDRSDALRACGDYLTTATAEDMRFFDVVTLALHYAGQPSVHGSGVARVAGPDLYAAAPGRFSTERPSQPVDLPPGGTGSAVSGVTLGTDPDQGHIKSHPGRIKPVAVGLEVKQHLIFAVGGNAGEYLGLGWSPAEPDFIWTMGQTASLHLPRPERDVDHVVQMVVTPFVSPGLLDFQRVAIEANGQPLGTVVLPVQSLVEVTVPASLLIASDRLDIVLRIPTARRPLDVTGINDDRQLGICVREMLVCAVTPPPPRYVPAARVITDNAVPRPDLSPMQLTMQYESIGENCEFGLVQRRAGAEPLGLFRFASAPYPKLLAALEARFAGFGQPDMLHVQVSSNGTEYMVLDRAFGFLFHTWVPPGEATPETIGKREARRLPFLLRKLVETLTEGSKIFVYHGMEPLTIEQATRMAAAIQSYGPCTLLWVELADSDNPAGSVVPLGDGLLKGYVDRFAPGEAAHDFSFDCWMELCKNAYAFWTPP